MIFSMKKHLLIFSLFSLILFPIEASEDIIDKDSLSETFYESGQLQKRVNTKDGKQEGLWEVFYESGKLQARGEYKEGKLDGLSESYYENGQLERRGN